MPQQNAAQKQNLDSSELQGEFVVGGGRGFYSSEVRSLETVDSLQWNLTPENGQRMRYDAEVESSVEFLIDSVFADGIAPVPVITDEDEPDYEEAKEIAAFVAAAVEDMPRSLEAVLREVFRGAFYAGAKCGEIVLKPDADGNLILDRINPKPNAAVGFVCDKFNNVLGIVGAKENGSMPSTVGVSDEDIIPREKFLIQQFELEDNDPRGIKKIRAAFDGWCDKRDTRTQWKEWRRTSAIPKKVGIAPPNAREIPLRDATGQQIFINNVPQTTTVEKGLMKALEGFANNSTITAPNGTDIKQLEVQGTGQQFTNALKFNNSEIRKAILGDSVSTGEDDKGVKSAKQVAMNVVDLRVKSYRNSVADAVERDVFRLLTVVNFGEDKAHLTPRASLGDTERRDWATDLTAANGAGYQFAPEHFPEIDVQFGLKPIARQTIEPVDAQQNIGGSSGSENSAANQEQGATETDE